MVEVARRAEYADCTPQAFDQFLQSVAPSLGSFDAKKLGELEEELNIRLKHLGSKPFAIDRPEMLGGIFKKLNASGFAMLLSSKQDTRTMTMASGMATLRIKQRLVFAYLYRKYESSETVSWIRKNLEAWADAILARNPSN
jgi:hypothetical protein